MDIVSHQFAGENRTMFPLVCSEELKRVGTKLQSTAQVRNQPILQGRLAHFSVRHNSTKVMEKYTALYLYQVFKFFSTDFKLQNYSL